MCIHDHWKTWVFSGPCTAYDNLGCVRLCVATIALALHLRWTFQYPTGVNQVDIEHCVQPSKVIRLRHGMYQNSSSLSSSYSVCRYFLAKEKGNLMMDLPGGKCKQPMQIIRSHSHMLAPYRDTKSWIQSKAAASILEKIGVPRPVTGSQPLWQW